MSHTLCGRRRPESSNPMRRTLITCLLSAGWLLRLSHADTYDIGVKLFTDPNCLFPANEFMLLDGGCYANKWAPNSTKGFKMNIVYFNSPQRIDMREYVDDCNNLAMPKRTVTSGTDVCNPFLGSMYAQFDVRFRSNTCQGQLCSTLAVAVQTFYQRAGCAGPAHSVFRFPVQGECLRAQNGTQDLMASGDDSTISLHDYGGGDDCTTSSSVTLRTYSITNQFCYPLYSTEAPRSFQWKVERNIPMATTSRGLRPSPGFFTLAVLFMGLREVLAVRCWRGESLFRLSDLF